MEEPFRYFVGIDWGTQTHRVAVLRADGRAIEQFDAAHSGDGLVTLSTNLDSEPRVRPHWSRSASRWLGRARRNGFSLFSINPKQVDRFRDRFTVAGAKDDSRDAFGAGHIVTYGQTELQTGADRLPRVASVAGAED